LPVVHDDLRGATRSFNLPADDALRGLSSHAGRCESSRPLQGAGGTTRRVTPSPGRSSTRFRSRQGDAEMVRPLLRHGRRPHPCFLILLSEVWAVGRTMRRSRPRAEAARARCASPGSTSTATVTAATASSRYEAPGRPRGPREPVVGKDSGDSQALPTTGGTGAPASIAPSEVQGYGLRRQSGASPSLRARFLGVSPSSRRVSKREGPTSFAPLASTRPTGCRTAAATSRSPPFDGREAEGRLALLQHRASGCGAASSLPGRVRADPSSTGSMGLSTSGPGWGRSHDVDGRRCVQTR